MVVVRDVLVANDVLDEQFHCNLNACKGACCWEGDFGAPLEDSEKDQITKEIENIIPFLEEGSQKMIREGGAFTYYQNPKLWGTSCHSDGACVFLVRKEGEIAQCGIEKAYKKGETTFRKPLSCHLYPIRVSKNEISGFEAWNYDRWDICNAACSLGKEKQIPVYRFVKDAIIRAKGQEFYDELDAAAQFLKE
ncbi:MAG: DUF3109 family protein [Saprospiraceae bacterium]|nr:DUF3109 family protein [Saprospiraceae bacterium]